MGVEARGLQGQLARMVEGRGTGFHADAGERDAGGAAWRNEGGGQQLRLHVPVQLGKHPLSLHPALPTTHTKVSINDREREKTARLHLRRHAHHARQRRPRPATRNYFPLQQTIKRRRQRRVCALRRREDARTARRGPGGGAKAAGGKGARGHGEDRGGAGGDGREI